MQLPQLVTDRAVPQLSVPETAPQFLPTRVQKATSVSETQGALPPLPQPHANDIANARTRAATRRAPGWRVLLVHLADARHAQGFPTRVSLKLVIGLAVGRVFGLEFVRARRRARELPNGMVEALQQTVNISKSRTMEHKANVADTLETRLTVAR